MSNILSGCFPKNVFTYFEDICSVPHGSGNTSALNNYCIDFARKRGLWFYRDSLNNVIIKKPASSGFENHAPVALQGHLDMVCEKREDVNFDFLSEGIRLKTDGDFIFADGTTLGGDDGIAVAMALAILDDNTLKHPPIEAIFTSDEETGMYGAKGLDTKFLTAKRFINIDSENEGVFTVGCAGGARVDIKLPIAMAKTDLPAYAVEVSGLIGGHSGTEIDKGRLNANKILGGFLKLLNYPIICSISGGSKDNAIPVNAECVICTSEDIFAVAEKYVSDNRVRTDSGLKISVSPTVCDTAFDFITSKKIIDLLYDLPCGVQSMSKEINGLVETSLNIGIMRSNRENFSLSLSVRSSKSTEKASLIKKLKSIAESSGTQFSSYGDYPAWEYRKNSPLREVMTDVFENMYGKKPEIEVIHAGLECGILGEKIKGIDAVSIGPDLFDIHTPRERMSISSVGRTYEFVCKVLEAL